MSDPYVYKAGQHSIITLQITGKTNEKRSGVVDANCVKFRTDRANVVDIENFKTNEKMMEDGSIYRSNFVYRIGEEVKVDDYDEDINEVCTSGIHYFKTRELAEYWYCMYRISKGDIRDDSLYKTWHENGRIATETNYKDGKKNGLYRGWHRNGNLATEANYKNGILNGLYRWWHENGHLLKDSTYKDGILDGLYKTWRENGQFLKESTYKDGVESQVIFYPNNKKV
jgi:antitoxin component YwqK of YwqJK toxin-antitoxin module